MAEESITPESAIPKRTKARSRISVPRIEFTIDQDTIDRSAARDSAHCMLSEALRQARPNAKNINCDLAHMRFTDPEKNLRYTYLTPRAAQIALIYFDRGIMPKPFRVRLRDAAVITRTRGGTPGAGRIETSVRQASDRATAKARYDAFKVASEDEPFEVSPQRKAELIKAMDDPKANLGFAVMLDKAGGGRKGEGVGTVVGGRAPASVGNLARKRRYGARLFLE
jgi:hypothetical protein